MVFVNMFPHLIPLPEVSYLCAVKAADQNVPGFLAYTRFWFSDSAYTVRFKGA